MIIDGALIIDWNGTLAWSYMWDLALYYETISLTDQATRDLITDMMDWSFTDDYSEGYYYGVGTGTNSVLSADLANGFADAAINVWKELNYTEARKQREYIESQLPSVERDLRMAENAMKKFSLISPNAGSMQGVEYVRLKRECDIQNATYVMLRKEYESVKLEESKQVDPFSVIEMAKVPIKPVARSVRLRFMIGLILGMGLGVFTAFFLEYWERSGRDHHA